MTQDPSGSAESQLNDIPELQERAVVLVKPDGVVRGLVGKIIARFEDAGLKLVGLKLVKISRDFANRHQPESEDWIKGLGQNTLNTYKEHGRDPAKELGTDDALEIGKKVANWNIDFLTSGPIVAMAWEGHSAIKQVRKLVGHTLPIFAVPGTIRGDFSKDSPALANAMKRSVRNVVHASGNKEEAEHELALWFGPEELYAYERTDWTGMFGRIK
ncbi:MAG: nucleoside-diphosphate kinase [bacterium]|nr:nucleoside-diphosphate kinase [bacterium]